MAGTKSDVTPAELAVMQSLWQHGKTTTRQITDDLYPGGSTSHYCTVQKLLERLEAKGYVGRDRSEAVHRFEALAKRDALIGVRLQAVAESLCDGSFAPLLMHLVERHKLSAEERKSLRELVARSESKAAAKHKSKK